MRELLPRAPFAGGAALFTPAERGGRSPRCQQQQQQLQEEQAAAAATEQPPAAAPAAAAGGGAQRPCPPCGQPVEIALAGAAAGGARAAAPDPAFARKLQRLRQSNQRLRSSLCGRARALPSGAAPAAAAARSLEGRPAPARPARSAGADSASAGASGASGGGSLREGVGSSGTAGRPGRTPSPCSADDETASSISFSLSRGQPEAPEGRSQAQAQAQQQQQQQQQQEQEQQQVTSAEHAAEPAQRPGSACADWHRRGQVRTALFLSPQQRGSRRRRSASSDGSDGGSCGASSSSGEALVAEAERQLQLLLNHTGRGDPASPAAAWTAQRAGSGRFGAAARLTPGSEALALEAEEGFLQLLEGGAAQQQQHQVQQVEQHQQQVEQQQVQHQSQAWGAQGQQQLAPGSPRRKSPPWRPPGIAVARSSQPAWPGVRQGSPRARQQLQQQQDHGAASPPGSPRWRLSLPDSLAGSERGSESAAAAESAPRQPGSPQAGSGACQPAASRRRELGAAESVLARAVLAEWSLLAASGGWAAALEALAAEGEAVQPAVLPHPCAPSSEARADAFARRQALRRGFRAWLSYVPAARAEALLEDAAEASADAFAAARHQRLAAHCIAGWTATVLVRGSARAAAASLLQRAWLRGLLAAWAVAARVGRAKEAAADELARHVLVHHAWRGWVMAWCRAASARVFAAQLATRRQAAVLRALRAHAVDAARARAADADALGAAHAFHCSRLLSGALSGWWLETVGARAAFDCQVTSLVRLVARCFSAWRALAAAARHARRARQAAALGAWRGCTPRCRGVAQRVADWEAARQRQLAAAALAEWRGAAGLLRGWRAQAPLLAAAWQQERLLQRGWAAWRRAGAQHADGACGQQAAAAQQQLLLLPPPPEAPAASGGAVWQVADAGDVQAEPSLGALAAAPGPEAGAVVAGGAPAPAAAPADSSAGGSDVDAWLAWQQAAAAEQAAALQLAAAERHARAAAGRRALRAWVRVAAAGAAAMAAQAARKHATQQELLAAVALLRQCGGDGRELPAVALRPRGGRGTWGTACSADDGAGSSGGGGGGGGAASSSGGGARAGAGAAALLPWLDDACAVRGDQAPPPGKPAGAGMSAIDGRTVLIALGIDLGIGLGVLTLFSALRVLPATRSYYNPRTAYAQPGACGAPGAGPGPSPWADPGGNRGMPPPGAPLPPALPRTLLTWIGPLLRLSEPRVIAAVGLDVAMLLRFIRFCAPTPAAQRGPRPPHSLARAPALRSGARATGPSRASRLRLRAGEADARAAPRRAAHSAQAAGPPRGVGTNLRDLNLAAANATAAAVAAAAPASAATPPDATDALLGRLFPTLPHFNTSSGAAALNPNGTRKAAVQLGPGTDVSTLAAAIEAGRYVASDLDRFSMANVPAGSSLLWLHLASAWLLLWSATSSALRLYLGQLTASSPGLESASHTALVADILGMVKATALDKVVHNWMFRLLPASVKARLRAAAAQLASSGQAVSSTAKRVLRHGAAADGKRGRWRRGARGPAAAQNGAGGGSGGSGDEGGCSGGEAEGGGAAASDGGAGSDGAGSDGSAAGSTSGSGRVAAGVPRDAASTAAAAAAAAAAAPAGGGGHPDQAAAGADASAGGGLRHRLPARGGAGGEAELLPGDGAPGGGVQLEAGVGGFGVFTAEWRRAAGVLKSGVSVEEFVRSEFSSIYGPAAVVAVHVVCHTPAAAALVSRYGAARTALEDALEAYELRLARAAAAAAAAGRRRRGPLAALRGCLRGGGGGGHGGGEELPRVQGAGDASEAPAQGWGPAPRTQRRPALRAVPVRTLPMPKELRGEAAPTGKQQPPGAACAGAAPGRGDDADGADGGSQPDGAEQAADRDQQLGAAAAASPSAPRQHCGCWRRCGCGRADGAASDDAGGDGAAPRARAGGRGWLCLRRAPRGDALDVLLHRLGVLRAQLADAQAAAAADPLPAAFVTFRTRTALTAAVGARHVAEAGAWSVSAAPPPDSIVWARLGMRYWEAGLRRWGVYAAITLLALTYVAPVAAVQGLLQLERLQRLPVVGALARLPVVHSLLLGVLPGAALRLFVLLLPVVLYALNRRGGAPSLGTLDNAVAMHYFSLQVILVFFSSFVTGSLLNQVNVLFTRGVGPVLDRLGTGAPQTANFFILYIIFTAFIGRSWALLRPFGILFTAARRAARARGGATARRRAVVGGTYRMFGPALPEASVMLLLGLVFAVVSPLVLVAALIYFGATLVVESYQWVYVYRRPYEGGGRLWKQLWRHVFVALYLAQGTMLALLLVKRFAWAPLLLPLIGATALAHHLGNRLLQDAWDVLAMRAAHELDLADRREAASALARPCGGGGGADDDAAVEALCTRQAEEWADLFRPPGVQVLAEAERVHSELARRVAATQARLARHNAAAAAEAAAARARA
ncbi:CSC1-like protein [Scenedesmus sp. PABB004]|nr:CSC1-like protein [Scenedesmus sp. PABB004]